MPNAQQDTTTGTSLGTPLNSPASLNYAPSNGVPPTPAPAAVTAPASITPAPSQTQSTNVTTLGQPTLSSSQLPTPSPYAPAPVPDLSTITAQGNAPTASQGQYDDITSQIGQLTSQLGGQGGYEQGLETQYNIPQLTSTANDLTANISQIQNQRDSVQQNLKNQYGNDASKGYLDFEQQSVDSVLSAKQSAYAATLATISGQLSTAKSLIDTAVSNKYTPLENQIDALNKQATLVKGTLDNEQQKQLAVMQAQLTDRTNTIAANKAITSSMLEKIATAAANAANPAPAYVVTQAQNAALGDDPASALAIIAPYLNDPLAAQAEIANIKQSNASAAASYASANYSNAESAILGGSGGAGSDVSGSSTATPAYTVNPGDTFTTIAAANGTTPEAIAAANPGVDPNNLKPGQSLNLSAAGNAMPPTSTGAARYSGNDPIMLNAQQVVDGLALPPTSTRSATSIAQMAAINKLSMAQTGKPFDANAAKAAYAFRSSKQYMGYVANAPVAVTTISAIAQLAKQANVSNLSDLNNVVNTGHAAGLFATPAQQSAAKQLQSKLAQSQDDIGLLLGTGTGSDAKLALGNLIFQPNGGVKSTTDLANAITTTIQDKMTDYATQAGVTDPQQFAQQAVQSAFARGQQQNNDYSSGSVTTSSGKSFDYAGAIRAGYTDAQIKAYLSAN